MTRKRISIVAAALAVGITFVLLGLARRATSGSYTYPIDDAYIHLAIAKNIASYGSYGLYPNVFTGASSSLVWPVLLGAFYKLWPSTHIAWILATTAAATLPIAVERALSLLSNGKVSATTHGLTQGLILFATPLAPLALSGMEHLAHALFMLLLAVDVARFDENAPKPRLLRLFALGLMCAALRYESLALGALCILMLLAQKHVRAGVAVLGGMALPPSLFALYSKAHGWPGLPNSVILKSRRWDRDTPQVIVNNLREAPHLLVLFAVLVAALIVTWRSVDPAARRFSLLALGVLVAHMLCGGVGWFYRYEAYVIPVTLVAIALLLSSTPAQRLAGILALPLLLLLPRGASAHRALPQASRNIFDEQVQTARFVHENFDREAVLINDIGAVAYFSHAPFVDLMGLANQDTARARGMRIDRPLGVGTLEKLSEHADVAIVYEEWFRAEKPTSWTKVGEFRTEHNRVCAFPSVSVFATRPDAKERVEAAFRRPR